jgi:hypothetical protein
MTQVEQGQAPRRWRNFLVKSTVWLSSELVLGLIGLDTVADYGEFLMQNQMADHLTTAIAHITMVL